MAHVFVKPERCCWWSRKEVERTLVFKRNHYDYAKVTLPVLTVMEQQLLHPEQYFGGLPVSALTPHYLTFFLLVFAKTVG